MVGKVQLSFDQRQGLHALQQIERFTARTDRRLVSRQRLHSPADGVSDYFIAEQLGETVGILKARQNEIEQGIEALDTTVGGIASLQEYLRLAKGFAADALITLRDASVGTVADELKQGTDAFLNTFNNLILAAEDTEYLELNLLTSTEQRLLVRYSEDREQLLRVPGRSLFTITTDFETGGIFSVNGVRTGADAEVFSLTGNRLVLSNFLNVQPYPDPLNPGATLDFSFNGFSSLLQYEALGGRAEAFFEAITENIDRATDRLEVHEQYFASNLTILRTREAFTIVFSGKLEAGRQALTRVDVNEEAVTLSLLQTRNALAVSSLALLDERHGQLLRLLQ